MNNIQANGIRIRLDLVAAVRPAAQVLGQVSIDINIHWQSGGSSFAKYLTSVIISKGNNEDPAIDSFTRVGVRPIFE